MDKIAWVDIEASGLDPYRDIILEIGLRITNLDGDNLDEVTSLVWTPGWRGHLVRNEAVFEMHRKSGLIEAMSDLERSVGPGKLIDYRIENVEMRLAQWMHDRLGEVKLPMAGNSVHYDRSFLGVHAPNLLAKWHYRNFDVSSTREQMRILNPELFAKLKAPPKKHRPQGDIDDSVYLWKWLMENFLFDARAFG